MITTALLALSLLSQDPPRQATFQCEARIPWPGVMFLGIGETEADARAKALESCHINGHAICFITGCTEL